MGWSFLRELTLPNFARGVGELDAGTTHRQTHAT